MAELKARKALQANRVRSGRILQLLDFSTMSGLVINSELCLLQDTQDLEDVLSDRLQQLPQPHSCVLSESSPPARQEDDVFSLETDQQQGQDIQVVAEAFPTPSVIACFILQ